ncbi:MAG: RseA family anti-sigma factor, partial [Burkholderiaceae bacterium]
ADADARMRVSALIDSELDDAAIDATLDALLASESLSRFWLSAHCAGDWLRSDEVVGVGHSQLALRRFSMALAAEPAIVAPKRARRSRAPGFWMRTGLPGASIAAALVAVAWVATPLWRGDDARKALASSSAEPTVVIAKASPVVEPEARSDEARSELKAIDSDRLSPYLAAHRDVTPFAYRGPSAMPAAFNTSAATSALPAPQ